MAARSLTVIFVSINRITPAMNAGQSGEYPANDQGGYRYSFAAVRWLKAMMPRMSPTSEVIPG